MVLTLLKDVNFPLIWEEIHNFHVLLGLQLLKICIRDNIKTFLHRSNKAMPLTLEPYRGLNNLLSFSIHLDKHKKACALYIGSRYGLVLRSILMADHQLPTAKNMMANTTQHTLTVICFSITSALGLVTFYQCQLTANMRHYFLLICPTQHCNQKMITSWYNCFHV